MDSPYQSISFMKTLSDQYNHPRSQTTDDYVTFESLVRKPHKPCVDYLQASSLIATTRNEDQSNVAIATELSTPKPKQPRHLRHRDGVLRPYIIPYRISNINSISEECKYHSPGNIYTSTNYNHPNLTISDNPKLILNLSEEKKLVSQESLILPPVEASIIMLSQHRIHDPFTITINILSSDKILPLNRYVTKNIGKQNVIKNKRKIYLRESENSDKVFFKRDSNTFKCLNFKYVFKGIVEYLINVFKS